MKKTGEILKKTREEKHLSIHEIGLSLKINSKILKAIEEGDLENLPAKTFLRGFVQSYAQYLKLNVDDVLKLFTEEMGTTKPQTVSLHIGTEKVIPPTVEAVKPDPAVPSSPPKAKEPTPVTEARPVTITSGKRFRNVTLIASVIVLITLILITKRVIDRYQNEAVTTSEPEVITATTPAVPTQPAPIEPATSTEPPPETASTVSPATPVPPAFSTPPVETAPPKEEAKAPTTPFVSPSTTGPAPRSAVNPPIPPPVSVAPHQAPVTTPPASLATQKPQETKSSMIAATTTSSTLPPEPAKPIVNEKSETKPETPVAEVKPAIKNIELIIEALDNVDVEYSTASGKNEKFHLEPEQLHTIKSRTGVKLNISNGGAISIIVNGKEIGIPGVLGKPIKLTY